MDKIKIDIHLTINSEKAKEICDMQGWDREQFVKIIAETLEENMGDTINDNEEVWEEKIFEIE